METIITDIPQDEAKQTAEDPQEFLVAFGTGTAPLGKTRLIGITTAEHEALKRGATLLLGQPSEGMQPITQGQELLAIVGYVPGEAPRMDTERVRLRVTGETFEVNPMSLTSGRHVTALTGHLDTGLPILDLTTFLQAVCTEIKSFDPETSKIAIPVEVVS